MRSVVLYMCIVAIYALLTARLAADVISMARSVARAECTRCALGNVQLRLSAVIATGDAYTDRLGPTPCFRVSIEGSYVGSDRGAGQPFGARWSCVAPAAGAGAMAVSYRDMMTELSALISEHVGPGGVDWALGDYEARWLYHMFTTYDLPTYGLTPR